VQDRLEKAEASEDANSIGLCHIRLEEIDGYQAYSRAARLLSGLGFNDADIENPLRHFSAVGLCASTLHEHSCVAPIYCY